MACEKKKQTPEGEQGGVASGGRMLAAKREEAEGEQCPHDEAVRAGGCEKHHAEQGGIGCQTEGGQQNGGGNKAEKAKQEECGKNGYAGLP